MIRIETVAGKTSSPRSNVGTIAAVALSPMMGMQLRITNYEMPAIYGLSEKISGFTPPRNTI
jgi:hypothetical protein